MQEIESLQQAVWRFDDHDIVPLAILVATREVGAILVGAFAGASLVGFAYSFVGRGRASGPSFPHAGGHAVASQLKPWLYTLIGAA